MTGAKSDCCSPTWIPRDCGRLGHPPVLAARWDHIRDAVKSRIRETRPLPPTAGAIYLKRSKNSVKTNLTGETLRMWSNAQWFANRCWPPRHSRRSTKQTRSQLTAGRLERPPHGKIRIDAIVSLDRSSRPRPRALPSSTQLAAKHSPRPAQLANNVKATSVPCSSKNFPDTLKFIPCSVE
jgi:hypothetical protein